MPSPSPSPSADDVGAVIDALRENVIFISVAIALAGVIVAVIVYLGNARIARRRATIDAWQRWGDDTAIARARLADQFQRRRLTRSQATELVTPIVGSRRPTRREVIDEDRRSSMKRDLSYTLNGLERLAAGVHHRVFERRLLTRLAGTTIQRSYVRFEEYMAVVREGEGGRPRQPRAFSELERYILSSASSEQLERLRGELS